MFSFLFFLHMHMEGDKNLENGFVTMIQTCDSLVRG